MWARVIPGVMRLPMSAIKIPEMRNIAKVFLALGLLFILGSDCVAQRRDVLGWEGARWGMSEAELLNAFNSRLKKLPERMEFMAQYADYVIPELKLEGESFTVYLQMDKSTNKLSQVLVRLNEQVAPTPREQLFHRLASSLAREYGEPSGQKDERYSFKRKYRGIELERTWRFPATTVELGYGWDDQIHASLLTIRYFPTKSTHNNGMHPTR
jgi:hypothetical protein